MRYFYLCLYEIIKITNTYNTMTEFRYSVCEPLHPKVIEKGTIAPDCIIGVFDDFQWDYYLKQMEVAETRKAEIYFSPSLEVENKANKHGLTISAVGNPEEPEFYIFYKRPVSVVKKRLFRKPKTVVKDYINEITGQTKEDVVECLSALIGNDLEFLRKKMA